MTQLSSFIRFFLRHITHYMGGGDICTLWDDSCRRLLTNSTVHIATVIGTTTMNISIPNAITKKISSVSGQQSSGHTIQRDSRPSFLPVSGHNSHCSIIWHSPSPQATEGVRESTLLDIGFSQAYLQSTSTNMSVPSTICRFPTIMW